MQLQTYIYNRKTYTVDYRLRQLRHVSPSGLVEFIAFSSDKGDRILCKLIKDGLCRDYSWL